VGNTTGSGCTVVSIRIVDRLAVLIVSVAVTASIVCVSNQSIPASPIRLRNLVSQSDDYIRWYNESRIKISLGSRSPDERRRDLGIAA
jgi:hypothetical protein